MQLSALPLLGFLALLGPLALSAEVQTEYLLKNECSRKTVRGDSVRTCQNVLSQDIFTPVAIVFSKTHLPAPKPTIQSLTLPSNKSPKTNPPPLLPSQILVHYRGTLQADGSEFDASYNRGQPLSFTVGKGQVIQGWDEGLLDMCVGDKRKLTIPPEFAYGERAMGPIPAGSTLGELLLPWGGGEWGWELEGNARLMWVWW